MSKESMITDLKNMAGQALRMWGLEEDSANESVHTQAYAQICTAIAALNAPKPFIQIGPDIINRADIVRVEILEAKTYTDSDRIMWPKRVKVVFRDIDGGTSDSSYSTYEEHPFDSREAKAILAWFEGQVEVLVPYEGPEIVEQNAAE